MDEKTERGTTVKIDLNGEFTASEMDEILRDLGTARAGMLPAVPLGPPTSLDAEVMLQDEALFKVRTLVDGGARIWLRSEGFGWLAFTLPPADVLGLREFLGKKLGHSYTAH